MKMNETALKLLQELTDAPGASGFEDEVVKVARRFAEPLGEIKEDFPRAALCEKDDLHYILVTVNEQGSLEETPTITEFRDVVYTFNVRNAYALDGGQTAVIAMNDKLINRVHFGYQRKISDIIYFATAMPNGG